MFMSLLGYACIFWVRLCIHINLRLEKCVLHWWICLLYLSQYAETLDPEVRILSLAILSPGRPDIVLLVPANGNPKGMWFTLKEGSKYNLKFTFQVNNNIVSGLRYTNTVWKTGVKGKTTPQVCIWSILNGLMTMWSNSYLMVSVDRAKEMLGTFSPQLEPYNHVMPEETTPSGMFARGSYSARTKVWLV